MKGGPLRARIPLRSGVLRAVIIAAFSVACAEFVRSGLYLPYLGQSDRAQAALGLPPSLVGLAWAVHIAADTVMRGPAGLLIARYGLRPVMIAGAALSLLALALLPAAHVGWALLLIAVLHGVGFSAAWPGAMNLTADATPEGVQGRALTAVSMVILPFIGLGYFLFGTLRDADPAAVYVLVMAGASVSLAAAFLLPGHAVRGPSLERLSAPQRRQIWQLRVPLLPAALLQTVTLSLFGQVLFSLADALGLSYWVLLSVLGCGALTAFGSLPLLGRVADRGRAATVLALGFGLIGVGMAVIATLPPVWAMYPLAALVGLGFAGVQPGWGALVTRVLPEKQRPAAWGILMTVENAGVALGPVMGSFAFQQLGAPGPVALGGLLALTAAAFYVLFRRTFPDAPPPAGAGA